MTAESTGVEGAGVYRGEGHLHLVASQRPQSCSRESRKDRHLDGITMDQVVEPVETRNSRLGMSVDMCLHRSAQEHCIFRGPRVHGHRISNSLQWKAMDRGIVE